jgi:aspartyl/asparaginyl beta-hydroxylase (cupin superfamily)
VLADLNLRLRLARLLSLEPGGVIREHSDSFLSRRIVRLHVPIITAPEVELYVGGARCHWKAGELWYGDFSLPHRGVNRSNLTRVHLVLDVTADDNLLALFQPEEIPLALAALGPMESEGEVDPRLLERFAVDFTLPPGFSLPGAGHQNLDAAIDGCIRLVDSELCVFVNQQPMLKASPVSEDTLDLPGLGADARLEYAFQNDAVHSVTLTMGGAPIFSFEVRSPA